MLYTYTQRLNSCEILRTNMKRLWLCRILHSYALLHHIALSSVVSRSVCHSVSLSFCQSVTLVSSAKTAETIKLSFAFRTPMGRMNHVLHEVQMPTWEGAILRGNRQTIVKYRDTPRSSVKTRLNRSRYRLHCGLA